MRHNNNEISQFSQRTNNTKIKKMMTANIKSRDLLNKHRSRKGEDKQLLVKTLK